MSVYVIVVIVTAILYVWSHRRADLPVVFRMRTGMNC